VKPLAYDLAGDLAPGAYVVVDRLRDTRRLRQIPGARAWFHHDGVCGVLSDEGPYLAPDDPVLVTVPASRAAELGEAIGFVPPIGKGMVSGDVGTVPEPLSRLLTAASDILILASHPDFMDDDRA
jgi:hypothetical protein